MVYSTYERFIVYLGGGMDGILKFLMEFLLSFSDLSKNFCPLPHVKA